jgi:hypothetical protein
VEIFVGQFDCRSQNEPTKGTSTKDKDKQETADGLQEIGIGARFLYAQRVNTNVTNGGVIVFSPPAAFHPVTRQAALKASEMRARVV